MQKLSEIKLKNLYSRYVNDNFFLYFKDFDESEQFFEYLSKNKLIINRIKHGVFNCEQNGWGYAVRETI